MLTVDFGTFPLCVTILLAFSLAIRIRCFGAILLDFLLDFTISQIKKLSNSIEFKLLQQTKLKKNAKKTKRKVN